jgi:hypothetical protein
VMFSISTHFMLILCLMEIVNAVLCIVSFNRTISDNPHEVF